MVLVCVRSDGDISTFERPTQPAMVMIMPVRVLAVMRFIFPVLLGLRPPAIFLSGFANTQEYRLISSVCVVHRTLALPDRKENAMCSLRTDIRECWRLRQKRSWLKHQAAFAFL